MSLVCLLASDVQLAHSVCVEWMAQVLPLALLVPSALLLAVRVLQRVLHVLQVSFRPAQVPPHVHVALQGHFHLILV